MIHFFPADKSTSSSASRREKSLITSVSSAIPLEPLKGSSKLGISQQLPQLSHSPNLGSNTQELQQQPGSTTVASGGVRCERKVTNSSSSSSTALGGDPSTNTTTIQHSLTPDSQFTNLFGTPIHTRPNSQPSEQQSTASPATPTNGSNGGNGHRNVSLWGDHHPSFFHSSCDIQHARAHNTCTLSWGNPPPPPLCCVFPLIIAR